jgi:hypothetical protein
MSDNTDDVQVLDNLVAQPFGDALALPSDHRFDTEMNVEPRANGVIDRMMRPDHFLNMLRKTHESRIDILVNDIDDLNLKYYTDELTQRKFFAINPNPKLFPVGSKAREWFENYKTMSFDSCGVKSMHAAVNRNFSTLRNFSDSAARLLSELHDWFRRSNGKGLIIRTNTALGEAARTVYAVTPGKFNLISDYELMCQVFEGLNSAYGDCIRGVQSMSNGVDDSCFRVVFGNPIYSENGSGPEKNFMMLNYVGSEHGIQRTEVDLGLWRMVCVNGAMRRDLNFVRAVWGRFNSPSKFLNDISRLIDMSGVYANSMSRKIEELRNTDLIDSPMVVLRALDEQRLIDTKHLEAAMYEAEHIEELNCWGMMNVLTAAARAHASSRRRGLAESRALMYAMQKGSFNSLVSEGFRKHEASKDLTDDLRPFIKKK